MNLSKIADYEKHTVIDRNGYLTDFQSSDNTTPKKKTLIKMIACGDTSPVRKLENKVIKGKSSHILGNLKPVLQDADLVFANLEAVYSNRGVPLDRVPVFRLNPKAFDIIKEANINVVSLANNHMFDYGHEAFVDTLDLLQKNNINSFGAGLTLANALKPAIFETQGIRFGFIGFRDKVPWWFNDNGVITPQIQKKIVLKSINALRPKVDWLILSLHFGWEYQLFPSPKDVNLCRFFIESGVNIILGHHPHYPQGIEKYKDGLIVYSLGNFVWDQNLIGHTNSSYMTEISLSKGTIQSVKVIPFCLKSNYQLELLNDNSAIEEINLITNILRNKRKLNEQWYFVSRNKMIEQIINIKNFILQKKIKKLLQLIKGSCSPRWIYTILSILLYFITGRAIWYEVKKRVKKRYFPNA